ncbi:PQ loop repeat-domain-containing protein [Chlamydoabsidia padenii]|nr:PQ loop repeat-domain-containing protein [Chlamydoabsidia padenii]
MTQCLPVKDGVPLIHWINFVFGDCTYGYLDGASVLLGYLSILFWLNAQFPQVIENYRRGSVEGLSINFLSIWLAGDTANLVGCILTNQLAFQRYLSIYFVSVDICLLVQYFYYAKWQRRGRPSNINRDYYNKKIQYDSSNLFSAAFQHPSAQTPLLIQAQSSIDDEIAPYSVSSSPNKWYTLTPQHDTLYKTDSLASSASTSSSSTCISSTKTKTTGLMTVMLLGLNLYSNTNSELVTATTTSTGSSSLLTTFDLTDPMIIGTIFAWSCTTLYLMSRIPQIRKNLKRRSVEGLSPSLFVFAVCGNLTYASSILLHPGQTRESLLEALPYLIGSAGTLTFDFTIFVQFLYYTRRRQRLQKKTLSGLTSSLA